MIFSESYLFVLIISSCLLVSIGLTLRTLLKMRHRMILPIKGIRITNGLTEGKESGLARHLACRAE